MPYLLIAGLAWLVFVVAGAEVPSLWFVASVVLTVLAVVLVLPDRSESQSGH